MLETLVTRVESCIEQHNLLPTEGEIIVAVSGGADSLCLLHVLHRLCGPEPSSASTTTKCYPAVRLHVAHLNHGLRGEAGARDAAYVSQLAESWGLSYTTGEIDVPALAREEKRSLEDAARVARYRFLREVAQGQRIAVAHQADDQVETLLLHWLRGDGLSGMMGMMPRQQDIIRPLLGVRHDETVAYCQQHDLAPLEDASNVDPRFLRNRIRHELLPLLETMNPGIRETLLRNAEVARVDLDWIEEQVDGAWLLAVMGESADEARIELDAGELARLPISIQRHLMRRVTARLCGGQSPLELRHHLLIEQFMRDDGNGFLDMPDRLRIGLRGKTLEVERIARREAGLPGPTPLSPDARTKTECRRGKPEAISAMGVATLPVPGHVVVPEMGWLAVAELLSDECAEQVRRAIAGEDWQCVWRLLPTSRYSVYVDADAVGPSILVRARRPGDRMQPLGMEREKKIQDIMVDGHIPRGERAMVPLFFVGPRCIWVAGICIDERVKLRHETRRIVKLSFEHIG
jgi:tRNA(Ile)-lysidine synthase